MVENGFVLRKKAQGQSSILPNQVRKPGLLENQDNVYDAILDDIFLEVLVVVSDNRAEPAQSLQQIQLEDVAHGLEPKLRIPATFTCPLFKQVVRRWRGLLEARVVCYFLYFFENLLQAPFFYLAAMFFGVEHVAEYLESLEDIHFVLRFKDQLHYFFVE